MFRILGQGVPIHRRMHRRTCRSGWNSGGTHDERRRWVGAEWGEIWGGVSPPSRLGDLGERRELPQRGPGQQVRGRAPAENGFWRILKATERSFL